MLHMLDTEIACYVIKGGSPEIQQRLMDFEPSNVCISSITCGELVYGLKSLPQAHGLHISVRQFLKIVRILPWDAQAAAIYADIRHQLKSTGNPIGDLDMMIAAHSIAVAAVLVTNNTRHFERIDAPLTLQNWAAS